MQRNTQKEVMKFDLFSIFIEDEDELWTQNIGERSENSTIFNTNEKNKGKVNVIYEIMN